MILSAYLLYLLIGLTFTSVVATLILLVIVLEHDKALRVSPGSLESKALPGVQDKTNEIINKTIKQANKILVNAELKGVGLVAKEKIGSERIAKEFEAHMAKLEESLEKHFDENLGKVETDYTKFLENLERSIAEHAGTTTKSLDDKATAFINQSQQALDTLTADVKKRVDAAVETELVAARAAVDEYRQRRMKIIDENIVEILEKTLRIALGKKMSLADQSDLIYKALEEAKEEHALG